MSFTPKLNKDGSSLKKYSKTVAPTLSELVNKGVVIIAHELAYYEHMVKKGDQLTPSDAKKVVSYLESLKGLSKESREAAKDMDFSGMDSKELLKLLIKSDPNIKLEELVKLLREDEDESEE